MPPIILLPLTLLISRPVKICLAVSRQAFKQMATSTKADVNHAIYASVIEKLKDGQQLFIDDAAIKKQFTFSKLVAVNMGEGSASLTGRIANNFNLPVQVLSSSLQIKNIFPIPIQKGNIVSSMLPKAPIYLLLHAC